MQVNVSKYLNQRIGEASTSSLCVDFKVPGDTLDVNAIVIGEEVQGNAIWYRNKTDNCFYWSEGVDDHTFLLETGDIFAGLNDDQKTQFLRSYIYYFRARATPSSNVANMAIGRNGTAIILLIEMRPAFTDAEIELTNGQLIFRGAIIPFKVSAAVSFKANIFIDTGTPFVMGGSMDNQETKATGTRGILVMRGSQGYLLTCFHVACYNLMKQKLTEFDGTTFNVVMPSALAVGSQVGPVTSRVVEGELGPYFDYAGCLVDPGQVENLVPGVGFINDAYTRADYNKLGTGTILQTFGCISGHKSGAIIQINYGKKDISYDFVGTIGILETIETEQISVPGDSGAPVFDTQMKLVGLIIANNEQTHRSLVMPIHQLFFNKNLSI